MIDIDISRAQRRMDHPKVAWNIPVENENRRFGFSVFDFLDFWKSHQTPVSGPSGGVD